MRRVFSVLSLGVSVLALPVFASAAPFTATYTFTGSPGNQASEPVDANPVGAIFGDILRGAGITASAGANSINSSGWTTGATADLTDFYEFTVTPQPGFLLDITDLEFTFRRSGTGPRSFELRNSLDGFVFVSASGSVSDVTDNFRFGAGGTTGFNNSIDLTGPITFRLYAFGAESGVGTFRLGTAAGDANDDFPANLVVSGDLTATVPEPATLFLVSAALAGGLRLRQRTRR